MEYSRHALLTFTTILFCTCVVVALPAGQPRELEGLLSHLFTNVLTKNSPTHDITADNWPIDNDDSDAGNSQLGARSSSTNDKNISALKQGFLGFNKRHGLYYDYGLGGGRFGKRYYGDYGIGGGRFGRDVDHVDIGDTNDATQ